MKPLLIFDYDGTIHDTMHIYEPAFRAAQKWLADNGFMSYSEVSAERIAGWLGMNSVDMWNDFAPQLPEEIQQQASMVVADSMSERIMKGQAELYAGADAMLDRLKSDGYPMIILSNCRRQYRDDHWKHFGLEKWFDAFYDCESYGFIPKADIAAGIVGDRAGGCIVIGDRYSDLQAAAKCGAKFIGCKYGFGTEDELAGADAFAENIGQIPEIVFGKFAF